jgi:hypothetical protein
MNDELLIAEYLTDMLQGLTRRYYACPFISKASTQGLEV